MGVNKFVFGGKIKLDLTQDTVTAGTLAKGITAHGADGEPVVGTMQASASCFPDVVEPGETIVIQNPKVSYCADVNKNPYTLDGFTIPKTGTYKIAVYAVNFNAAFGGPGTLKLLVNGSQVLSPISVPPKVKNKPQYVWPSVPLNKGDVVKIQAVIYGNTSMMDVGPIQLQIKWDIPFDG